MSAASNVRHLQHGMRTLTSKWKYYIVLQIKDKDRHGLGYMASLVDWLQPVESIVFKKGSGLLLHTEAPVTMHNMLDFPPPPPFKRGP